MDDSSALFHQYETEYCNGSTEISRKLGALGPLTGGACGQQQAGKLQQVGLTELRSTCRAPP
jgi:hypothetical protein